MKLSKNLPLAAILLLLLTSVGQAENVIYDEDISGDLSSDPANPTVFSTPLSVGTHTFSGQAKNALDVQADPEYWTVTLAEDAVVSAIRITEYENDSYEDKGGGGFFGVAEGTEITATNVDTGNLVAGAVIGVAPGLSVGDNILDDLRSGLSFGPFDISPRSLIMCCSNRFTFWFQEGNPTPDTPPEVHPAGPNDADDFVNYTFEFDVIQVPEPATGTYLIFCALFAMSPRWRRRHNLQ